MRDPTNVEFLFLFIRPHIMANNGNLVVVVWGSN